MLGKGPLRAGNFPAFFPDIDASPLDEMVRQFFPSSGQGSVGEVRSKQRQNVVKSFGIARMRRRSEQDHMTVGVFCQAVQQDLPLGCAASAADTGMRLVHDDKVRAGSREVGPAAIGLYVIQADNGDRMGVEGALVQCQSAFESRRGRGGNGGRMEVELFA